jgi:murein endopeptidase
MLAENAPILTTAAEVEDADLEQTLRQNSRPDFIHLTAGPGYILSDPELSWGTRLTVSRLEGVLADHYRHYPHGPPIVIKDLSRRFGGRLKPHQSHRTGRDADIRLISTLPTNPRHFNPVTPQTLDLERNWHLVNALLKTGDVVYIFMDTRFQRILYRYARQQGVSQYTLSNIFQYPRRPGTSSGIIRHEPGHRGHMHVRFRHEQPPQQLAF